MSAAILIVEDNMRDFEFLRQTLANESYTVVHASTGAHAMTFLKDNVPDLIFLDLLLPDTDGFELCRFIRESAVLRHVPVIMLTSSASGENKMLALQTGVTDFLAKGMVEPREVVVRVRNALRMKALYDDVLRGALFDTITQSYNRRYFQQRLTGEFGRAMRYQYDLSCVIVDIDHFSQLTAAHGQQAGAVALRTIATVLRGAMRIVDIMCRYGEDQFSALLPETDLAGAHTALQRIMSVLGRTPLWEPAGSGKIETVTVSVGIASLRIGMPLSTEEFLTQAEVALVTAKRNGRNQVSCYGVGRAGR